MDEEVLRHFVRDMLKKSLETGECPRCMRRIIDVAVDEMVNVVKDNYLTKKDVRNITKAKDNLLQQLDCAQHSQ